MLSLPGLESLLLLFQNVFYFIFKIIVVTYFLPLSSLMFAIPNLQCFCIGIFSTDDSKSDSKTKIMMKSCWLMFKLKKIFLGQWNPISTIVVRIENPWWSSLKIWLFENKNKKLRIKYFHSTKKKTNYSTIAKQVGC